MRSGLRRSLHCSIMRFCPELPPGPASSLLRRARGSNMRARHLRCKQVVNPGAANGSTGHGIRSLRRDGRAARSPRRTHPCPRAVLSYVADYSISAGSREWRVRVIVFGGGLLLKRESDILHPQQ